MYASIIRIINREDVTLKKKKKLKWIIGIGIGVVALIIFVVILLKIVSSKSAMLGSGGDIAVVEKGDMVEQLSSSGMLTPYNSYKVTASANIEGTILSANFEEGDTVKKGQVLYTVGAESLDSKIISAQKSVQRAQDKVNQANKEYQRVVGKCSDYTVKANSSGYVKDLMVKKGDYLTQGATSVATIYNNKYMTIVLPFNASQVSSKLVGKTATVTLSDTDETIKGTVTKVTSYTDTLSGNRVVRYVTIQVKNQGGLNESVAASASIGNIACNEEGYFKKATQTTVISQLTGKISSVLVREGRWVKKGEPLVKIEDGSYDDTILAAKNQVESAEEAYETAKEALNELTDSKSDYVIKSPITGTIVKKNGKVGDKVSAMQDGLCTVYDLSSMTLEMMVDELDILKVKKGQKVTLTADAIEGVTYEGEVTSVCLEGKRNGNVTQYPVVVRINDTGELLPGMSVKASILVKESKNTLMVDARCLMRNNMIYIKDSSVKEENGEVPAGFRAVKVEVGICDGVKVEILSGLKEGDEVYLPPMVSSGEYMDEEYEEEEYVEEEGDMEEGDDYE